MRRRKKNRKKLIFGGIRSTKFNNDYYPLTSLLENVDANIWDIVFQGSSKNMPIATWLKE